MSMHFCKCHFISSCSITCLNGIFYITVPIAVVASFRKMKKLTKDISWIVAALKESALLVSFTETYRSSPKLIELEVT